ncbi:ABC transporter substrate-binding protein [Termitidicoccus mucosus]|uniref:Iron ABC transporter substrate-binding protein n=1 Tax=Termitidicoccus mucosus TaxID=1184151 RepID=A0A178IQ26_9BACT|nr:hypothetical protein AW736_03500 [Opitutaceae bacterium TSB47]
MENTAIATPSSDDDLLDLEPSFPEHETGRRRALDYLGYAPCPVRAELRRRFHARCRAMNPAPQWYMAGGCHGDDIYDGLWQTTEAGELPGLISDTGFGDFNRPAFVRRWLDDDKTFARIAAGDELRPEFREAGLVDPQGFHRVYGANLEIILVDLNRLGDRPTPRNWADVLHPRFRRDVIVSGSPESIHESILFGLYRDHGEKALAALGANVRNFMHPAEMAKTAGSSNPRGAALYLLPGFFSASCPHRENTRVVWPEEGAYLTPQYILRRRDARPESDLFANYLCGGEWAAHLAKIGFAPSRAGSPPLPGRLRWVGWDFVRHHDIEAMSTMLNAAFARGYSA